MRVSAPTRRPRSSSTSCADAAQVRPALLTGYTEPAAVLAVYSVLRLAYCAWLNQLAVIELAVVGKGQGAARGEREDAARLARETYGAERVVDDHATLLDALAAQVRR